MLLCQRLEYGLTMNYMKSATLLTIGLLFTSCASGLNNGGGNGTGSGTDLTLTSTLKSNELNTNDQQALLGAINAKRASGFTCPAPVGNRPAVPAVTWNAKLELMSLKHTNVLVNVNADLGKIDPHSGVGDGTVSTRATGVGYAFLAIGENIAAGQLSVTDAMTDWLGSSGHCGAIMDADFTQIGASKLGTNGGAYATYWTLNFGKPK
jgi:uncharacterized protein YkwD